MYRRIVEARHGAAPLAVADGDGVAGLRNAAAEEGEDAGGGELVVRAGVPGSPERRVVVTPVAVVVVIQAEPDWRTLTAAMEPVSERLLTAA